jgi:hypothetical protein
MALAQLGLWLGLYAPLKVLLPLFADMRFAASFLDPMAGLSKEALLALTTLTGSFVALVANPLVGALPIAPTDALAGGILGYWRGPCWQQYP